MRNGQKRSYGKNRRSAKVFRTDCEGRASAETGRKKMNEALRKSIADRFGNTSLGLLRIKRNLGLITYSDSETEDLLRTMILSTPLEDIETKGKNHYFRCFAFNATLTVNSNTFTVITAKRINKESAGGRENL